MMSYRQSATTLRRWQNTPQDFSMDERKRDSMIAYLRHRMDDLGISPDDLASFLTTPPARSDTARYRSAGGDTWSGEGEMPQWLKQATSAGQSVGHFELLCGTHAQPATQTHANWKNDPFAGKPACWTWPCQAVPSGIIRHLERPLLRTTLSDTDSLGLRARHRAHVARSVSDQRRAFRPRPRLIRPT